MPNPAFIPALRAAAFLALSAVTLAAQRTRPPVSRAAVVNTVILMDSIPGRSEAESGFALEATKARLLVAEAADSLKRAVDDFTRERDAMSPARREAVLLVLRAKEITFEDMVRQLEVIGESRRQALRAPFEERITDAIRVVRKREGYAVVLDRAALPALLDYDATVDITPLVLAELRKAATGQQPLAVPARP